MGNTAIIAMIQSKRHSERNKALLALLLGATCIAFAPIFVRMSEVGPVATAFYRLAFAFPWLLIWWLKSDHDFYQESDNEIKHWRKHWVLGLSGLFFAADLALWHWSIKLTTVANATLFANFAPIFVVIATWLIWHERVSGLFLGAIALVLVGMACLASASLAVAWQSLLGDVLGIFTAVFYAGYLLTVAKLRSRYATVTVALGSSLVGGLTLGGIGGLAGDSFVPKTLRGWLILVGLAFISQVLGQSFITYALAHLPTAFSSVGLLLQPAIATLLGWSFFGESLSLIQWGGFGLVLGGIYWARLISATTL